jgi:beta-glucosidase
LVTGSGARDIGKQCGGWTLSWQGTGNSREDFPNGETIFEGLAAALEAGGGQALLSEDGTWTERPDAAIVVFGEDPYAEGVGDRANVDYAPDDGLEALQRLKSDGIPTISVFLSGRPLWVNPELNASDAFVAAWLPGSEGGSIADLLIADAAGRPRFDFTGRLSFSWPANALQAEVNVGDSDYHPLFAYGYGLSYGSPAPVPALSEDPGFVEAPSLQVRRLIERGDPAGSWRLILGDSDGDAYISDSRGQSPGGSLSVAPADRLVQEDTTVASWVGPASLRLEGQASDLRPGAGEKLALELQYQVLQADAPTVTVAIQQGVLDVTEALRSRSGLGWQTSVIGLACFVDRGAELAAVTRPLTIHSERGLVLQLGSARLVEDTGEAGCDLQ